MMVVNYTPVSSITLNFEYKFINPDISEVNNIINKTIKEHDKKAFACYRIHPPPRKLDFIYDLDFTHKVRNKIKNVKLKKKCNINHAINSRIIASNQRYEFDKKVTVVIQGRITKLVINTHLKMRTPMGVREQQGLHR